LYRSVKYANLTSIDFFLHGTAKDVTKVIFLAFFYSSIFPAGFLYAFLTLSIYYFTDKFCLLYTWRQLPAVNTELSRLSDIYFVPATVVIGAIVLPYSFASFPYDNACKDISFVASDYVGMHNGTYEGIGWYNFSVEALDHNYFFCEQYYWKQKFPAFPDNQPPNAHWMTITQKGATLFLTYASIVVFVVVGIHLFNSGVLQPILEIFQEKYEAIGIAEDINYGELTYVSAYVPKIQTSQFPQPFIACDIIPTDIIATEDDGVRHSFTAMNNNNLSKDLHKIRLDDHQSEWDLTINRFSIFEHWPVDYGNS